MLRINDRLWVMSINPLQLEDPEEIHVNLIRSLHSQDQARQRWLWGTSPPTWWTQSRDSHTSTSMWELWVVHDLQGGDRVTVDDDGEVEGGQCEDWGDCYASRSRLRGTPFVHWVMLLLGRSRGWSGISGQSFWRRQRLESQILLNWSIFRNLSSIVSSCCLLK